MDRLPDLLERCTDRLQRWQALDAPSYQVEHVLELAFLLTGRRSRPLQDLLHGVWLGHPLHPVLVTVPVGAWTATLLLDVLDAAGRSGARQAATATIELGIAGAAAAALTGLTDWQHAHDGARRLGLVHATLNTAALGLCTWSAVDRRRGRPGRARATAAGGYALTAASSYLGGALAYRHRLGTDHSDPAGGPDRYVPVLDAAELVDGEPRGVDVGGVPAVVVPRGEAVDAVGGRCPHLGGPLAEGWLYRGSLVCPWHGSRFDPATGRVVQGPSTAPLPCFDVRVEAGRVELRRRAAWRSPTARTTLEQASR